ncbi:unnamed protein product [Urochloa humidicola]
MPSGTIRRLIIERKKMRTTATTNDSTVPTGTKHKRKRKATINGTTAMTVRNQPAGSQEALAPRCATTDGSTATTDTKHKKKKKKKKNTMIKGTTTTTLTNQPVGGQEAIPLQQTMTGGSNVTTTNSTTATIVRRDESVGGQESLPSRLTTINASTAPAGKKRKRKKKKKTMTTAKGATTTTITHPVGGQEVLLPRSCRQHKIEGGKQLITVKLHEDLINSKPDVSPRTGSLSEAAVHQHFVEQLGPSNVEWVNQGGESGRPYDIVITRDGVTEYVMVKERTAPGKNGFHTIQPSEWQFLCEKRDSSSIALVSFPSPDEAAIVILRNPCWICKSRRENLVLALVVSSKVSRLGRFAVKERKPAQEHGGGNGIVPVAPVEEPNAHRPSPPGPEDNSSDARANLLQSLQESPRRLEGESDLPRSSIEDRPGKASDYKYRSMITGRLGEAAVYQYLVEQHGAAGNVNWVNRRRESGLPYDIVVTKKGGATEYMEVKTTIHPEKNWFRISESEWRFVQEKGASLSIARVVLQGEKRASIVMLKNPRRLCEQQDLNLTLVMRRR